MTFLNEMWQLAIQGKLQGIWFWTSVYLLLLCAYSLIRQVLTRQWPATKGHLIELGLEQFNAVEWVRSNQEYSANAVYVYEIDGQSYEGSKLSSWTLVTSHNARFLLEKQMSGIEVHPDGSVSVFYNPNNPKKSLLIKPSIKGIVFTALLATLPMLTFIVHYLTAS